MARRPYCLVGGIPLKVRWKIVSTVMLASIIALLAGAAMADSPPADPAESVPTPTQPAITTHDPTGTPVQPVETVPVNPVPSLPASLPVPGEQVRTMLFQRVRTQIVLYRNKTWRLQSLLGQRRSPGGNIWNLGSPEAGKKTLRAWQSRSYQLQLAARQRIQKDRRAVEYMLLVMGKRPAVRTLASSGSIADQLRQMKLLTYRTDWQIHHPPHLAAFTCIHHFEGSWKDTGAPFWGGLQMDYGFQQTYGGWLLRSKGTANYWTPLEQIWTAEKAVQSRGFHPWPNTARYCGLI
jgi:hypothetical protein